MSVRQTGARKGPVHTRALIIGTGFSGLGMGIALQKAGVDFLILEKADDIGGTWRDNTYPGCACDIPSHMYSFSFEQKPDWSHMWSFQPEILEYLKGVATKHDLQRFVRFGSKVVRAKWDEEGLRWHVFTDTGQEYVSQFLVSGAGALHIPLVPDFEGINEFRGAAFHSAEWDQSVDLTGKRVAIIGTGASAIQIVPAIVNQVAELQLYQRTPPWVLPRVNSAFSQRVRDLFTRVPLTRQLMRDGIYWIHEFIGYGMTRRPALLKIGEWLGKWNIRRSVRDPELRRKLTPDYAAGCKRILNSGSYYPAIANPKTDVVTERIARIAPEGIVTVDGTLHEADVIVYATGFHVTDSYTYVDIIGPQGEALGNRWNRQGVEAHRGITVADMPNLFFLLGPNTGLGHNSVVFMIEQQIRYVVQAINAVDKAHAQALAPSRKAQDQFNETLQRKLEHSVWNTGGCRSWYMDEHGKNRTLWSGTTWLYWLAVRRFKKSEYRFQ